MISKVREWLDEQGFTLEMRAAEAFRAAGFEVRQSSHYIDGESGKGREIDVIAHDPDRYGIIDITFIVECKASKKPWVLLCSTDTLVGYNRFRAFGVLSKKAIEALLGLLLFGLLRRRLIPPEAWLRLVVSLSVVALFFVPYRTWQFMFAGTLAHGHFASEFLTHAAAVSDLRTVRRLVGHGLSVEATDRSGGTAAHAAAVGNQGRCSQGRRRSSEC